MTEFELLKWLGGRKFTIALLTLFLTSGLLLLDKVDTNTFENDRHLGCFGVYHW